MPAVVSCRVGPGRAGVDPAVLSGAVGPDVGRWVRSVRWSHSILAVTIVMAAVVVAPVDRGSAGEVPSTSAVVDFGITGPDALAAWSGRSLTPTTMVPLTTEVKVFLGFRTDLAGLEARAAAVSDPASPLYGRYETLPETIGRFGVGDEQLRVVVEWFGSRGVTVVPDGTRTYALVTVSVDILQELTGVAFGTYSIEGAAPGLVAVTSTVAVSAIIPELVPAIDRVYGVSFTVDTSGVETASLDVDAPKVPHPASVSAPAGDIIAEPADGGTPWRTGTPTDACPDAASLAFSVGPVGLSPAQLRSAYGVDRLWDRGFRGRGARVAVVDFAPYDPADLDTFRECFGLEGTPVTDHVLGPLSDDEGQRSETTLDLQTVVSFAPDAERIDWFGVPTRAPTAIGAVVELIAPAFDVSYMDGLQPDVVSVSFAICEQELVTVDPGWSVGLSLFEQIVALGAASGVGTFIATGDQGSTGCFPTTNDVSASFPATSRWVTAVGGTNLTLDPQNRIVSSGTWNDARMAVPTPPLDAPYDSSGGGLSSMVERQSWQPRIGESSARPIPDVSMFAAAQPGYFQVFDGVWRTDAGTSAASPALAAMTALQSSSLAAVGRPRLGFVAPLLHSLSQDTDEGTEGIVVDVTLGTSDVHGVGVYAATPGYDLATGIGWIRQDELFNYLHRVEPSPVGPVAPAFTG
jgi:subtilase family serine protease